MKKFNLLVVALVSIFVFASCNDEITVSNVYRAEISDYHYASPFTGISVEQYLELFDLWNGTDMTLKGLSTEFTDIEAVTLFNASLKLLNEDSIANRLGENDYFVYTMKRKASENASEEVLKSVRFTHQGILQE